MRNAFEMLLLALIFLSPAGCAKKKKEVSSDIELQSLSSSPIDFDLKSSSSGLSIEDPDSTEFFSGGATLASLQKSVNADSLLFPIYQIGVTVASGSLNNTIVYSCPGTGDACLVDLADPSAVEKLLSGVVFTASSDVGEEDKDKTFATLDGLSISTSPGEGSTTNVMKIKASTSIAGYQWYTAGNDKILSASSSNYDYVSVLQAQNGTKIKLTPIALNDGDSIKVSMFVSIQDAITVALTSGVGGCANKSDASGSNVADRGICATSVDPAAYIGDAVPTSETYLLSVGGKLARFTALFDSADTPLTGFFRPYSDGSSEAFKNVGGGIESLRANGDETYTVLGYGSGTDGAPVATYDMMTGFKRESHSGSLTVGGQAYSYQATKL